MRLPLLFNMGQNFLDTVARAQSKSTFRLIIWDSIHTETYFCKKNRNPHQIITKIKEKYFFFGDRDPAS